MINRLLHDLPLLALMGLALSLPFEARFGWLILDKVQWTNVELALLVCLLLGVWCAWQNRPSPFQLTRWLKMPASWLILWLALAIALLLSTLFAPESDLNLPGLQLNALKATIRTLLGIGIALIIPQIVRQPRQLNGLIVCLMISGVAITLIGIAEILYGLPFSWLGTFRILPTTVGPFMRLSASFEHANQAAIYLEVILFLVVTSFWRSWRQWPPAISLALGILALLVAQAILLTYSRSAIVTILLVCFLLALGQYWTGQRSQAVRWLGTAGILLLLTFLNALLDPIWGLRLSSEDDKTWYQAQFHVPDQLQANAGETIPISLTITNDGSLVWISASENPIHIGASWQPRNSQTELPDRPRWLLEQPVRPGGQISQTLMLTLPPIPGDYELRWDMVQEYITWFSDKTGRTAITYVTVTGELPQPESQHPSPDSPANAESFIPVTSRPAIPVRTILWRTAWEQFLDYPLLGIGLDNFRLTYGRYLDLPNWNDTIHTNNWYIETVVSIGIVGSFPFFLWLVLLYQQVWVNMRHTQWTDWQMAVAAGLMAYGIHGFLDYFLMFNPTALLFWILVGICQLKIRS